MCIYTATIFINFVFLKYIPGNTGDKRSKDKGKDNCDNCDKSPVCIYKYFCMYVQIFLYVYTNILHKETICLLT